MNFLAVNKFTTRFFWIVIFFILNERPGHCNDQTLRPAFTYSESMSEKLCNLNCTETNFSPVAFNDSFQSSRSTTDASLLSNWYVSAAKQRFDQFSLNFKNSSSFFSIPPIIHLIWLGSMPPKAVEISLSSWRKYHPNWDIRLWTDDKIENFRWSSERSKEIFLAGKNWAEKSDILRFEILYQYGGIYSDVDIICLKSFEDFVTSDLTIFAGFENNLYGYFEAPFIGPLIGSAIIGTEKSSDLMLRCIEYTQSQTEAPLIQQYLRSGPGPLTRACYEALEEGLENILILPCSYLYPLPWVRRLNSFDELTSKIKPESHAIHLWEFSWASPI